MLTHQQKQLEVIENIQQQIDTKNLSFTTVSPTRDYFNDKRRCLTSVHLPKQSLLAKLQEIIDPLREIEPDYYYYSNDSLHVTIKNIRVVNDPPRFTIEDIIRVKEIFSEVIPRHHRFQVYFYRLLLFPNNLALVGTTDSELDKIILDLDKRLHEEDISDDKKYSNTKYFFSNITLARFAKASDMFQQKVATLSQHLAFEPYQVDSVTLVTSNAVFKKRRIINTWELQ